MNRREFLGAAASAAAPRRPNILLFLADDWGRYAGAYRDPKRPGINDVVRTPHIDRVAREGVLFTNAFMATPSCTPSRAAIATGCYSFRCGSAANLRGGSWKGRRDPGRDLPGFGQLLGASGYSVGGSFKTLQANWLGGKTRGLADFHRYSLYLSEARTPEDVAARREQVLAQAREGLRGALAGRAPSQPFFYAYGPINAHRPWVRGSGKKLWGLEPDSLEGKLPGFLPGVPVVREDMADYLGEVQALDLMVGVFLDELEKSGELDNTLIVLTGDNGIPGMPRGKCNLYDFGVHAPLIVRWPGRARAGQVVDDFVNLMDLAPTFLEAAGLEPPAAMNGRSLLPQLTSGKSGMIDPARDFVVTSRERHVPNARPGNLPYPSRAIRTRDFLYIRNFHPDRWPMGEPASGEEKLSFDDIAEYRSFVTTKDMDASPSKAWVVTNRLSRGGERFYDIAFGKRPAEELYDLHRDPDCLRNVAPEARYAKEKAGLAGRLLAVLRQAGDPRLDDAFDRPPYVEETAG